MKQALAVVDRSPPIDPLEELRLERTALADELAALQRNLARLAEADASETAVLTEIGMLGQGEIAALKAWAGSNCEGPQPTPNTAEREKLSRKLAAASATATAARSAAESVKAQVATKQEELASLERRFEAAVLNQLERDANEAIREFETSADRTRALLSSVWGAVQWLSAQGRQLHDRGQPAEAAVYFGRAEAMGKAAPQVAPEPTLADVQAATAAWAKHAAGLRNGTAGVIQ